MWRRPAVCCCSVPFSPPRPPGCHRHHLLLLLFSCRSVVIVDSPLETQPSPPPLSSALVLSSVARLFASQGRAPPPPLALAPSTQTMFPYRRFGGVRMKAKVSSPDSSVPTSAQKRSRRRVRPHSSTSSHPLLAIRAPAAQKYEMGTGIAAMETMRPRAKGAVQTT